jgi:predicted anti-sigma-YlaC factor YlaD
MKEHIIEILDGTPFDRLSESELSIINAHSTGCGQCRDAFQAAGISAAILKFESAQEPEPSPFFQSRVMAALREQRSNGKTVWDFWRLWQASGSLVTMMVALVAMLMFAVVLAPSNQTLASSTDPTEAVIFEQDNTLDITNEQVFPVIFER